MKKGNGGNQNHVENIYTPEKPDSTLPLFKIRIYYRACISGTHFKIIRPFIDIFARRKMRSGEMMCKQLIFCIRAATRLL
jgi:hypothetical protein